MPALLAIAACSDPLERELYVDGTRGAYFAADQSECRSLAENYTDGSVDGGTTGGAVIGGITGALEADKDDKLEGALIGAAVGGVLGRAEAKEALREEQRNVLIRCMQNRGHAVIG